MRDQPVSFAEQFRDFLRRSLHWFLAAAFTLLLIQDVFGTHGILAMRRAQQEAASVRKEIDRINEENRQLQDNVKALKTDPQAIEKIAREEMGLARPDEYTFKIPPKPGDATAPAPQSADPTAKP